MKQEAKCELTYPRVWEYALIGKEYASLIDAIKVVLKEIPYKLLYSRNSSNGKFISVHISLVVDSKEMRDYLFGSFCAQDAVKMVI